LFDQGQRTGRGGSISGITAANSKHTTEAETASHLKPSVAFYGTGEDYEPNL
jgi:hypothetical protein